MTKKKGVALDEMAENYRKQIGYTYTAEEFGKMWMGPDYPRPFVGFNREATIDTIMHFVDGIGDLNPIYRDEDYVKKTKYGCIIAPPCFLYSVWWAGTGKDLTSLIHGWFSGSEWEWFRPIIVGDRINWKTIQPSDVQLKVNPKIAKKTLIVYQMDQFMRQDMEVIAIHKGWNINAEREDAVKTGKYDPIAKIHEYSEEEIEIILAEQRKETIRGANPRYWEDVEIGEELPPLVRGPLTMNEMIVWLIGSGNLINRSDRLWRLLEAAHPEIEFGFRDPAMKIQRNLEMPHIDWELARRTGAPGAYDFGCQRITWLAMFLSNWHGDNGFLWKLRAELRLFNIIGDTTWCKGRVVRKYCDERKYCVDIECWAENQRCEVTMPGKATVILPSREHGPVVYPEPRRIV